MPVVPVQGVKATPQSIVLVALGETRQLIATVSPANATDQAIVWESGDSSVVSVSAAGVITAKAVGSGVFVTAYSHDRSRQASVNVSVEPRGAPEAIYESSGHLNAVSAAVHGAPITSRYVFYANSTFALQFNSAILGFFEYRGRFVRTDSEITLSFNDSSIGGSWEAIGTLNGDVLSVAYNSIMSLSDFIDGDYMLSR
jgi:hypothetical protein